MEISVIKIGNSKGIRLPKALLKRYGIREFVELIFKEDGILIKPVKTPRAGWEEAFKEMHANGDDALLIDDIFDDEIIEE